LLLKFAVPLLGVLVCGATVHAGGVPAWLPRYDLALRLDTDQRVVTAVERVTWTNHHKRPTKELVFNAHAHYSIPDKDVGLLAKMVEILRMSPSESMSFDGPALEVASARVVSSSAITKAGGPAAEPTPVKDLGYQDENVTALVVPLDQEVGPGESVTVELSFTVRIPAKKGRWGQWQGITTLAQWLPVVAYYDDKGWQPAPFIPWHQPFFNEAGVYNVKLAVPATQKVASTGHIQETKDTGDGWLEHRIAQTVSRDFAVICGANFEEFFGQTGATKIRVLALPEHAYYAQEFVKIAAEAISTYQRWFGAFPYPQFTIVESYFGWNGNECGDLVMIDERMFSMPRAAHDFLDYLVSHEICHQWWYNVVGTNGYAETWMDEGLATHFAHKLVSEKYGKNNELIKYPSGLKWLPNIHRDDYRNYTMLGVIGRGQAKPPVSPMPDFGHLVNLNAMAYDRGSKVVGMIEERMGETAFLDFMRMIYSKYQYQILRVADYQRELEAYTGRSWQDFFQSWLYSTSSCDWVLDRVEVPGRPALPFLQKVSMRQEPTRVVVHLSQRDKNNEPCVLGIALDGTENYQIRVKIQPEYVILDEADVHAHVETTLDENGKAKVRVEIDLPSPPTQVSIDPDHVLLDSNPYNNHWKRPIRWRFTPLYTSIDEVDVTNAHDRWNVIAGPYVFSPSYNDPWFTRSQILGIRAGVFSTQFFSGGAYLGVRADDRNLIAGVDATWTNCLFPNTQFGLVVEQSLATLSADQIPYSRGVLYGRYIITPGSSLYLPPFEYVEGFGNMQNRGLPDPRHFEDGDPFDNRTSLGLHYHKNYLTPYWDPEGGFALDATYQGGLPVFGADRGFQMLFGQVSFVKKFPDPLKILPEMPWLSWLAESRLAFRLYAAGALPDDGMLFTLGGGDRFRGFDLSERQGSAQWVGSVEWRIPLARGMKYDCLDHFIGVRNAYIAPFYDIGNAYLNGQELGPVAHAVGVGFRLDISWVGLIERSMLRFDVAQALQRGVPTQFWFGVCHPF
jgi:hypothetical protein